MEAIPTETVDRAAVEPNPASAGDGMKKAVLSKVMIMAVVPVLEDHHKAVGVYPVDTAVRHGNGMTEGDSKATAVVAPTVGGAEIITPRRPEQVMIGFVAPRTVVADRKVAETRCAGETNMADLKATATMIAVHTPGGDPISILPPETTTVGVDHRIAVADHRAGARR